MKPLRRAFDIIRVAALAALAVVAAEPHVCAADITFPCATALQSTMWERLPEFQAASGDHGNVEYANIGTITDRVRRGDAADPVTVSPQQWESLQNSGKISAGTRVVIGKAGIGVSVKQGAAKPDIGSVAAFKRALLHARSWCRTVSCCPTMMIGRTTSCRWTGRIAQSADCRGSGQDRQSEPDIIARCATLRRFRTPRSTAGSRRYSGTLRFRIDLPECGGSASGHFGLHRRQCGRYRGGGPEWPIALWIIVGGWRYLPVPVVRTALRATSGQQLKRLGLHAVRNEVGLIARTLQIVSQVALIQGGAPGLIGAPRQREQQQQHERPISYHIVTFFTVLRHGASFATPGVAMATAGSDESAL